MKKNLAVIENASYYNVQLDKAPNASCKKKNMQNWLKHHKIPFRNEMLKDKLNKLKKSKRPYARYAIDALFLAAKGLSFLHLPLYHPELKMTELIW